MLEILALSGCNTRWWIAPQLIGAKSRVKQWLPAIGQAQPVTGAYSIGVLGTYRSATLTGIPVCALIYD